MKQSPEAIERYRAALMKYKKACSDFHKIRLGFVGIEKPNAGQYHVYWAAQYFYKKECKEYQRERMIWLAGFGDSLTEQIQLLKAEESMNLSDLAAQVNSPVTLLDAMKNEAFEGSEDFKTIKNAALKHIEEIQKRQAPIEEQVLVTTDEVDVFKDLP